MSMKDGGGIVEGSGGDLIESPLLQLSSNKLRKQREALSQQQVYCYQSIQ
jgi:hypothetical protein